MTIEEFAEKLSGVNISNVLSKELRVEAISRGFVVVYISRDKSVVCFDGAMGCSMSSMYPCPNEILVRDDGSFFFKGDEDIFDDYPVSKKPEFKSILVTFNRSLKSGFTIDTDIPSARFGIGYGILGVGEGLVFDTRDVIHPSCESFATEMRE